MNENKRVSATSGLGERQECLSSLSHCAVSSFDLCKYKYCEVATSPAFEIEDGTGLACRECFNCQWQSRLNILCFKQRRSNVEYRLVGGGDAAGSPGTEQGFVCGMSAGRTFGEPLGKSSRLFD